MDIPQFEGRLGADNDWCANVARLRLFRETFGPGPLVYGDWNCAAKKLGATRVGRAVAVLDAMLEQSSATLDECGKVEVATSMPMKIDENAYDTATSLRANALGCLNAVAQKDSTFDGLSALRRAQDLCLHHGARMCVVDTWGFDIVMAAVIHLAAATPAVLNVCDLSGYVAPRIDPNEATHNNGTIGIPRGALASVCHPI